MRRLPRRAQPVHPHGADGRGPGRLDRERDLGQGIGDAATTYVDVTDVFDRKIAALRAHVSQTAHMDELETMLRGWLGANALNGGLPEGRLAEGYRVLDTR